MKSSAHSTEKPKAMTLSIVEAAELLGICRNSAYDAAKRGDIPTLRIGKLIRVPRALLEKKLGAPQD